MYTAASRHWQRTEGALSIPFSLYRCYENLGALITRLITKPTCKTHFCLLEKHLFVFLFEKKYYRFDFVFRALCDSNIPQYAVMCDE